MRRYSHASTRVVIAPKPLCPDAGAAFLVTHAFDQAKVCGKVPYTVLAPLKLNGDRRLPSLDERHAHQMFTEKPNVHLVRPQDVTD
jgi:hypothetical protein